MFQSNCWIDPDPKIRVPPVIIIFLDGIVHNAHQPFGDTLICFVTRLYDSFHGLFCIVSSCFIRLYHSFPLFSWFHPNMCWLPKNRPSVAQEADSAHERGAHKTAVADRGPGAHLPGVPGAGGASSGRSVEDHIWIILDIYESRIRFECSRMVVIRYGYLWIILNYNYGIMIMGNDYG